MLGPGHQTQRDSAGRGQVALVEVLPDHLPVTGQE
jgi:hypothetical protein